MASAPQWHDAIEYVHGAAVDDVLADFDGIDATVMDILQRYRVRWEGQAAGHALASAVLCCCYRVR